MLLLNPTLFKNVVSMIPNAIVHDFGVKVPREHVGGLQPIAFVVKGHNPTLTPDQYMLTQWESHLFNVDTKMANLWFVQHPHPTGALLGQKFLEKFISCTIRIISVWGLRPRRSQDFLQVHRNRVCKQTSISNKALEQLRIMGSRPWFFFSP